MAAAAAAAIPNNPPAPAGPISSSSTSAVSDDGRSMQEAASTSDVAWDSSPTWTRSEVSHLPGAHIGDKEGEQRSAKSWIDPKFDR